MDDPHRKPGERDRAAVLARIDRAAHEGRIAAADRDIRVANVAGAQSMAELDLIARDLDQLESALPAGAPPVPARTGPSPPPAADVLTDKAMTTARSTARSIGIGTAVLLVVVLIGVGASALLANRSGDDGATSAGGLFTPQPITETADPVDAPSGALPTADGPGTDAAARSSLRDAGIRSFLRTYRQRFGTSDVVDLTLYGDYAVVEVPVRGKARHEGWLYREDSGFTSFGGVTADFPGARPVDTRRLVVPALVRNIARARRSLGVEDPTTTYVIVRQYTPGDEVPSVDIHVANAFGESGYLATTLDGTVERAYPAAP